MRSKEKRTRNLWLHSFVVEADTGKREGREERTSETHVDKGRRKEIGNFNSQYRTERRGGRLMNSEREGEMEEGREELMEMGRWNGGYGGEERGRRERRRKRGREKKGE